MANSNAVHPLDAEFYQPAERFFPGQTGTALTYDDVTLDRKSTRLNSSH